ncbi:MAG: molybdopterin-binding protein, partial [Klebsiella sp.]|nr:molybdopterin-binding protein [Klebsiella sp.]
MKGKAPTRRAPALEPDQKKQLVNVQRRLLLRSGLTLGGV